MRTLHGDARDLFRCFRIALDPKKLVLGFMGLTMTVLATGCLLLLTVHLWDNFHAPDPDTERAFYYKTEGLHPSLLAWFSRDPATSARGHEAALDRVRLFLDTNYGRDFVPTGMRESWVYEKTRETVGIVAPPERVHAGLMNLVPRTGWGCGLWCAVLLFAWAIWSYYGTAIARIAALNIARDDVLEMREASRYASENLRHTFAAPLTLLAFILFFTACIAAVAYVSGLAYRNVADPGAARQVAIAAGIGAAAMLAGGKLRISPTVVGASLLSALALYLASNYASLETGAMLRNGAAAVGGLLMVLGLLSRSSGSADEETGGIPFWAKGGAFLCLLAAAAYLALFLAARFRLAGIGLGAAVLIAGLLFLLRGRGVLLRGPGLLLILFGLGWIAAAMSNHHAAAAQGTILLLPVAGMPFALLAGFLIVILGVGLLFGWPLLVPAIATEGTDSFDAISRSISYLFAHPWRFLGYHLMAGLHAIPSFLVVLGGACLFTCVTLRIGDAAMAGSFTGVAENARTFLGSVLSPFRLGAVPADPALHVMIPGIALGLILLLLIAFAYAFIPAYLFCSHTVMYFLLRKATDHTPYEEVFVEEADDDEDLLGPPEGTGNDAAPPPKPEGEGVSNA